jgi:aromatic-L-amino-acid decarboxylase
MAPAARSPFDPSRDEMSRMGADVVDLVTRFIDERYVASTSDYDDLEPLLSVLRRPPPLTGRPLDELLATIDAAASKGFDTANPGFVGYIPGGGLYASALADFIACVINRYTGVAAPAPALVQLEAGVLRWLCDVFGLGAAAQGVLTPGGSMSNLSAIVTARTTLGEQFLDGTIYVSDEIHHSIAKAAQFAGLPKEALRVISTGPDLRMDLDATRAAIAQDRRRGRKPFLLVASAGTINTGAVDPLAEAADLARDEDLWFHVDAAYGGFFQLTQRGRDRLRGIERADSITLDPHKGLFLPYGTGCLLVADGAALRRAHEAAAHYLPDPSTDPGLPDFSAFSPELTRDFRGLRMWLPLHLHGVDAFVQALDEKLDLAQVVYGRLSAMEQLSVPWAPELSLVAFRPTAAASLDATRLLDAINGSGRMWLSSATFRSHTYLRMCILSHRTHRERIHEAVAIIGEALTDGGTAGGH